MKKEALVSSCAGLNGKRCATVFLGTRGSVLDGKVICEDCARKHANSGKENRAIPLEEVFASLERNPKVSLETVLKDNHTANQAAKAVANTRKAERSAVRAKHAKTRQASLNKLVSSSSQPAAM